MITSDLTFFDDNMSVWNEDHLWTTITIMFISVAIIAIMGIIMYFMRDNPHVVVPLFLLALMVCLITSLATPNISRGIVQADEKTPNKTLLQVWASKNYVIDLTDKQAEDLYENSMEYGDSELMSAHEKTIVSYYGENIMVSLVKYEDKWRFFSADKELPQVEKVKQ